jgi:hypothetical protein
MRLVTILTAVTVMVTAATVSVHTQGRGNGQAKKAIVSGPKASGSPKSTKQTATRTPKQTAKADQRVAKVDTRTAKATAKSDARAAKATRKAEARVAKADAKAARTSGATPDATASTTTAATTTPTTVVTPTTPTTQHVKNPKLEARLLALLPPGSTIQDASMGFKNWGQFVAATHVSNNLGIPFAELKSRMTGIMPGTVPGTTVQTTPMSLGQAIQSYKSTVPATTNTGTLTPTQITTEVKKAEDAATSDLRRTRESS